MNEAGDTLIEILVAVAILGIAASGLLIGLTTTISSSGTHKSLAGLDAVLRNYADSVRYQLQLQPNANSSSRPIFARCAANYTVLTTPVPSSGPPGTQAVAFGSGFSGGAGTAAIGGYSGPTTVPSGPLGSVTAPFTVPDMPAGPQTLTVTYGATPRTTTFTVTPFILSLSPDTATGGSTVTASVKGFPASNTLKVTLGGAPVTVGSATTDANGTDATLSFTVPAAEPNGTYPVVVTDSTGTYSASQSLTVATTAGASATWTAPTSSFTGFQVGLTSIRYWNGTTFTSSCATGTPAYEDLQQLTVSGTAPGASDALSFVVSDPDARGAHQVSAPVVTYTGPPSPQTGTQLTFSASITGDGTGGAPTAGGVNWVIQTSTGNPPPCTSTTGPTPTSSTTSSATCTISSPSVIAATYTVTAVYSGDSYYSTNQGSTSVTASMYTPSVSVTSGGLTDGTLNLTATVSGALNGPTPTESGGTWTVSGPATACTSTGGLAAGASQGTATDTCAISAAAAGTYTITYRYTGDSNYYAAQNTPAATFAVATFTVTSAVTGTGPTETLTFTATLTKPPTGPAPTGSVAWAVSGAASSCSAQTGLTGPPGNAYTAMCTITPSVPTSMYSATATFSGDPTYVPGVADDNGVAG